MNPPQSSLPSDLPSALRAARARARMTQEAAAAAIGTSTVTYRRWEAGDGRPRSARVIAAVADFVGSRTWEDRRENDGTGWVREPDTPYGSPCAIPHDLAVVIADRAAAAVRAAVLEALSPGTAMGGAPLQHVE